MRAMILGAGIGSRMGPLAGLCAKPALPVRGVPVVAILLRWLAAHEIDEVVVNLHHLPHTVRDAVADWAPSDVEVHFSEERAPLGSGGGIRRAAEFLRESDPCVVVSGDMLLDLDLGRALEAHRQRGDLATLVCRDDPRMSHFGGLGCTDDDRLRRIGRDAALLPDRPERAAGLFTGVRVLSRAIVERIADAGDDDLAFEDLRDVLGPQAAEGAAIRLYGLGEAAPAICPVWQPIGTPSEYLEANFTRAALSYLDLDELARSRGVRLDSHWIAGRDADVPGTAKLDRVVVWEGERVPAQTTAHDGVFASGRFIACATGEPPAVATSAQREGSPR